MPEPESESAPKQKPATAARPLIPIDRRGIDLQTFEDLQRFAQCVVAAGMAPKGMNEAGAVCAVQLGLELGMSPMQAIQNIAVVNGRPAVWGDSMLGICMGSGRFDFNAYDEGYRDGEGDSFCAYTIVRRIGSSSTVEWSYSIADAKRAKLWTKPGPWTTDPKRMLKYRARSFALRDAFPDVLKGLYTGEELSDADRILDGIDTSKVETKAGMRERLTKKSKPVPEPPPPPANETTTKGQAPPPIPQHLLDSQARILTHIDNLGDEAFGVLGNNGLESELELRACANPLILTKVEEEMAELAKTKGK